ncbi:hypothetical protein BC941DRAFT_432651 [Chlamydoabsidia padenii]|nr:hypothetical protein BC941DRAFT_432651 [Chlamydoabsidia padenii]
MTDLPLEIIDHIITFVDASCLYELGHVSRVLRLLSKKHLYHNHIQHVSIRLWMHQPGTMAHTPIDFEYQQPCYPLAAHFGFNHHQAIRFNPNKPIYFDGCTIIIHGKERKHYGITYQQPISLDLTSCWTIERQGQWSMKGKLEQDGYLTPTALVCNCNLFNPDTLDIISRQQIIRLQERIQQKQHRGLKKECCSATSCSLLPRPFTSPFLSISSS